MPHSARSALFAHGTTGPITRTSQQDLATALALLAFSPVEEDFFRTGDQMSEPPSHDFSDLDADYQRPSLWRALIGWLRGERTEHPE